MSDQPRLHFLHVSKTGGTAVREALADVATPFDLVMHGHPTTLRDVPAGEGVVFFLREPVSRFSSAFLSRQRRGLPRYEVKYTEREMAAFAHFSTPNELALALSSTDSVRRQQAAEAMRGINHVRIHYADWFHGIEYFETRMNDVFFVGLQESLDADFAALAAKLRVDAVVALPNDPVKAHRRPDNQDDRLDPVAIDNLRSWYADDIAFYKRCLALKAQINAPGPG